MAASSIPPLTRMPPASAPTLPNAIEMTAFNFVEPIKKIKTVNDLPIWEKSEAYRDVLGFILAMNDEIKGRARSESSDPSDHIKGLLSLLETLERYLSEVPPDVTQEFRFGNKAFRTWFKRLEDTCDELLQSLLPDSLHAAVVELKTYVMDSFGNSTRIDYGTGHELAFAAFLCCLYKIGFLQKDDAKNVVFKVFHKYLEVCRSLQLTYKMEPAGSHGAWSLDDHQFLCFLWGSAQLVNHNRITPNTAINEETCNRYSEDFLYLEAIQHISKVKTGPFHEHSNQLWNISGVPMWTKVNQGLIKMYKAEVLAKFPIIQHFFFGSLLSVNSVKP